MNIYGKHEINYSIALVNRMKSIAAYFYELLALEEFWSTLGHAAVFDVVVQGSAKDWLKRQKALKRWSEFELSISSFFRKVGTRDFLTSSFRIGRTDLASFCRFFAYSMSNCARFSTYAAMSLEYFDQTYKYLLTCIHGNFLILVVQF
jgi:hypothetical protein